MTHSGLASLMEWIRPAGIGLAVFFAHLWGQDAAARFHIMGPTIVLLMCGTVAFESLFLGEAASAKIGYRANREYQIQSGLANAAMAITAALVAGLGWGALAEATIVSTMLLFFTFSAANHLGTAVRQGNLKPVNLLRPALALLLSALLLPEMLAALGA